MSNLTSRIYRNTSYMVKELFWKPETINEEILVDRLRMNSLYISSLNNSLDNLDFPLTIGRFPEILREYPRISELILSSIDDFKRNYPQEAKNLNETRIKLRDYISKDIADHLSMNPDAFRRVTQENGN